MPSRSPEVLPDAVARPPQSPAPGRRSSDPLRLMLVDDDAGAREALARYLLDAGYLVETAASGEQALALAGNFRPHMVLTEWNMGGMDGLSLCRALRGRPGGQRLYIVLLTAHGEEESLVRAFGAGVDDFIPKPVGQRVLLARVQAGARLLRLLMDLERAHREDAERARLARQIQQAHKMQAIGKLTGGIAHNFNNHLAAILGYAELAQEMFPDVGDGQLKMFLDNILAAGHEAGDLVASLRAFTETGDDARDTPLAGSLLGDTVRMLRPILGANIALETDFAGEVPLVSVNQEQVYQMVMNLCINAREAMDSRGTIRLGLRHEPAVRAICAACGQPVSGAHVVLSVGDDGSGIDAASIEHIFDPFYSTKAVGKGTGLGLSIVHGIMHAHGGHVLVDSRPGEGSTFHLLFPVPDSDENRP